MNDASNLVGTGDFLYRPVPDWPCIPDDVELVEAVGVTVDADDNIFIYNRGIPEVLIFRPDGTFIDAWTPEGSVRPHGIAAPADGNVILTDDLGHRVARFSRNGRQLENIGPAGIPSLTGVDGFDYRSIVPAGPYNLPTNVAITSDGHTFVADGYGNARIHHFDADGTLLFSFGVSGNGDGEFNVPHGICVDEQERVLVADRENSRIQISDRSGALLKIWTDVVRPCQIFVRDNLYYVAELGNQNGRFPWQPLPEKPTGGRISILDGEGTVLSRFGGGLDAHSTDGFYACHDICVDLEGNIYTGEVAVTAATAAGEDPTGLRTLKKFARVR